MNKIGATLRSLVKLLPSPARRHLANIRQRYRLRRNAIDLGRERGFQRFVGKHVAVAGFFSARSGLARAAELVALTLEDRGSKVTRVDLTSALDLVSVDRKHPGPAECKSLDISDVVIVANPDQPSLAAFDREWLLGRTIIGHWIWEIEALPDFWRTASKSYDEIWAATDILKECFASNLTGFNRPLKVVPYAIQLDPFPQIDPSQRAEARQREQIPASDFVAGYSFSVDSNYYRKNPEDAVRAFKTAFPTMNGERLILRSHDLDHRPVERAALEAVINGDPRIRIYDAKTPIGIKDFYSAIDVYLSSSRAEGYGLNLVEASQAGLPVITGGWRIAPEILSLPNVRAVRFALAYLRDPQGHYSTIKNARWAAPDLAELAAALAQIRNAVRIGGSDNPKDEIYNQCRRDDVEWRTRPSLRGAGEG